MPKYNTIEAYSDYLGVDTYPEIQRVSDRLTRNHRAVNRSALRGLNDTRPPFIEIALVFQTKEQENVFSNAAISGMKFYQGEGKLFSSFLIVAVGNLILAGYIKPNSIEFYTIYTGIDPQWTHSYFCQALNILTFNNDNDPGLFWSGNPLTQAKRIADSPYVKDNEGNAYPMPISNISCFAHGRIFCATNNNLVYASNYIYSQGLLLEQRESVLSFKESTYPSSGDGFGAPSEMGPVTGITVVPQSDTLNGHGDVMVLCRNGVFSIAPNRKVRTEWTNDPEMQKNVIVGKGCVSNDSIISFANQIFYRDSNTDMSSLLNDVSNYQQRTPLDEISRQVKEYTSYDVNTPDIQFCSSFVTNNRVLSTVSHHRETSSLMGVHRYALGMVSACLQSRNNRSIIVWEGLWTGPRPVAAAMTDLGNNKRTIIASYDSDKKNRLYYIDEESPRGQDYTQGKYRSILSKFKSDGIFFDEDNQRSVVKKTIKKIEALLIRSNSQLIESTYTTDGDKEEYPIKVQLTEISGCGQASMTALSNDVCSVKSNTRSSSSSQGYYFGVTLYITGQACFAKWAVAGDVSEGKEGFNSESKCSNVVSPDLKLCIFDKCDPRTENFSYTF